MKSSILRIAAYCAIFSILLAAQESEAKKASKKPPKDNSHDGGDGGAMNPEDFGKALMNCIQTGEVTMSPERVAFMGEMQKTEEAKEKFAQCLMSHINVNTNPLKDPKFCISFDKTMDCACK